MTAARPQRHPSTKGVMAALCNAYAKGGVSAFAETRRLVERADDLDRELTDRREAIRALERDLAGRMLAGELDLDGAAVELVAVQIPGLDDLVATTLRQLARDTERAAQAEAGAAFEQLIPLAAGAVVEAVTAGGECVDVDAFARALHTPEYRTNVVPVVEGAPLRPSWPAAVAATARVAELRQLADMASQTGQFGIGFWRPDMPIGERGMVAALVPEPLLLAVGAKLGWGPGLRYGDRRPVPFVADGDREDRAAMIDRATKAAPLVSVVDGYLAGQRR